MGLKKNADSGGLHEVAEREYPRDAAGLIAQLQDPDAGARRWAARDLAAHPGAAKAVCARLADETDGSVRAVLFSTAAQLGGSAVVQGLVPLLRSEDAALRNGAIEVLAGLPQAVAPHIEGLLHDPDSDVRIFTVNLLTELRHPQVPAWLAAVVQQDTEINVVGAALEVLAEVGTAQSLPALRAAKSRFAGDAFIGFSVDLAIARIEGA